MINEIEVRSDLRAKCRQGSLPGIGYCLDIPRTLEVQNDIHSSQTCGRTSQGPFYSTASASTAHIDNIDCLLVLCPSDIDEVN